MIFMHPASLLQQGKEWLVVEDIKVSVAHGRSQPRLADPRARDVWQASLAHLTVVGFSVRADEASADFPAPDLAHALPGMTTVALADGPPGEDGFPDPAQIPLVNPSL